MKFLPSKEAMSTWEFILTVVITVIIAAELGFAWAGFYEAQDQDQVLKDLKEASKEQAATLKTLTDEQTKSLESLKQMNGTLQTSVSTTKDMATAMQKQLQILQSDQARRQAEAARKPKLEVDVAGVPLNGLVDIALKAREMTETRVTYDVALLNHGDAAATNGLLRIIAFDKAVTLACSLPAQPLHEEQDSPIHVLAVPFERLRPNGNITMSVTITYPKGQQPFLVGFNVDSNEIPVATALGSMKVLPPKPTD
jgi:hypothetical protein